MRLDEVETRVAPESRIRQVVMSLPRYWLRRPESQRVKPSNCQPPGVEGLAERKEGRMVEDVEEEGLLVPMRSDEIMDCTKPEGC